MKEQAGQEAYLGLEEVDEPGQVVFVLPTVSLQVVLNHQVARLAYLTLLTTGRQD